MGKSERICFRCTREQKRIIETNGKKAGMGVSQYILQAALEKGDESGAGKRKRVYDLAVIQKELNKLEHQIKLGAGHEELVEQFKAVQEGVSALWLLSK